MGTRNVEASTILIGDTVIIDGIEVTVTKSNIRYNTFMGTVINGCGFLGKIDLVLYPQFYKGELTNNR